MHRGEFETLRKIVILANHFLTIHRFRNELVDRLIAEGFEVHIVIPEDENDFFTKKGCKVAKVSVDRHGINPIKDLALMIKYFKIIKKISPDVVLTYTIKPNIYGGICCKLLKVPILQNITGLGVAVNKGGMLKALLVFLYKIAFNKQRCVFVQNDDNLTFLHNNNITPFTYRKIPGSGVNLSKYTVLDYPEDEKVKFLFIARIMKSKGIDEFIEAATHFKGKNVSFHVLGFCEDEYAEQLKKLQEEDVLIYHGMVDNVLEFHKTAHCTINPSYHEGMSNVLLEASACGRPCLCSNIPGCKEIVDDGKNGFLFEPKNAQSLIDSIEKFLVLSTQERKKMGLHARSKVENEFDRNTVIEVYLDEINKIMELKK